MFEEALARCGPSLAAPGGAVLNGDALLGGTVQPRWKLKPLPHGARNLRAHAASSNTGDGGAGHRAANDVRQGLSSSIFTLNMRGPKLWRHRLDCGIANVNIGTSSAEIGVRSAARRKPAVAGRRLENHAPPDQYHQQRRLPLKTGHQVRRCGT
jgi:aldehyde dehydrogenase (NAD+)